MFFMKNACVALCTYTPYVDRPTQMPQIIWESRAMTWACLWSLPMFFSSHMAWEGLLGFIWTWYNLQTHLRSLSSSPHTGCFGDQASYPFYQFPSVPHRRPFSWWNASSSHTQELRWVSHTHLPSSQFCLSPNQSCPIPSSFPEPHEDSVSTSFDLWWSFLSEQPMGNLLIWGSIWCSVIRVAAPAEARVESYPGEEFQKVVQILLFYLLDGSVESSC